MRACLLLCAALALAASRPRAAAAHRPHDTRDTHTHTHTRTRTHDAHPAAVPPADPARLHHIKTQILAKLGLSSRPTPLGAPPRDVVRQILARAADPQPERRPEPEHSMREIIAIAHRGGSPALQPFIYKKRKKNIRNGKSKYPRVLLMESSCYCKEQKFTLK